MSNTNLNRLVETLQRVSNDVKGFVSICRFLLVILCVFLILSCISTVVVISEPFFKGTKIAAVCELSYVDRYPSLLYGNVK
jgi:hypothetical protein